METLGKGVGAASPLANKRRKDRRFFFEGFLFKQSQRVANKTRSKRKAVVEVEGDLNYAKAGPKGLIEKGRRHSSPRSVTVEVEQKRKRPKKGLEGGKSDVEKDRS